MSLYRHIQDKQKRAGRNALGDSVLYVGMLVGLFRAEHLHKMGAAVFTYGCLLSKVTGWNSRYGLGAVLKGVPLKYSKLSQETGIPERTIRRHVDTLTSGGYLITLRKPRGLAFYITNYRPAGKPRLGQGEIPDMAVQQLANLADQGLVSGHYAATLEGISEHIINTGEPDLKHSDAIYFQPLADIFFLVFRLFKVQLGSAELRFLHRGNKHNRHFIDTPDLLKAIARTLMAHERKSAQEERSGNKPRGITNIVAYLNSGLHKPPYFLLTSRRGEESYIDRVVAVHNAVKEEIEQYKNRRLTEKAVEKFRP